MNFGSIQQRYINPACEGIGNTIKQVAITIKVGIAQAASKALYILKRVQNKKWGPLVKKIAIISTGTAGGALSVTAVMAISYYALKKLFLINQSNDFQTPHDDYVEIENEETLPRYRPPQPQPQPQITDIEAQEEIAQRENNEFEVEELIQQSGMRIRIIAGDGHCMFRSIAAGICDLSDEEMALVTDQIQRVIEANSQDINDQYDLHDAFEQYQETLIAGPINDNQINSIRLDGMVFLLRRIAAASLHNSMIHHDQHTDSFINTATERFDGPLEYLEQMANSNVEGSEIELAALSRTLQINIDCYHTESIERNQSIHNSLHAYRAQRDNPPLVRVLFVAPGHYNSLTNR